MKNASLLLMFLFILSCRNLPEEPEIDEGTRRFLDSIQKEQLKQRIKDSIELEKTLSDEQRYLRSKDVSYLEGLSPNEFNEFKNLIEHPEFKNYDFCEVYIQSLDMSEVQFRNHHKKLFKIPKFSKTLKALGPKLCSSEILVNEMSNKMRQNLDNSIKNNQADLDPCEVAKDFILDDLVNRNSADFEMFDCTKKIDDNGNFRVLRKVEAANALGQKVEFVYEVVLTYNGGDKLSKSGWNLISIRSEKYSR